MCQTSEDDAVTWKNIEPGKLVHAEASEMVSITPAPTGIGFYLTVRGGSGWYGTLASAKTDGDRKVSELREMGLL